MTQQEKIDLIRLKRAGRSNPSLDVATIPEVAAEEDPSPSGGNFVPAPGQRARRADGSEIPLPEEASLQGASSSSGRNFVPAPGQRARRADGSEIPLPGEDPSSFAPQAPGRNFVPAPGQRARRADGSEIPLPAETAKRTPLGQDKYSVNPEEESAAGGTG